MVIEKKNAKERRRREKTYLEDPIPKPFMQERCNPQTLFILRKRSPDTNQGQ